MREGDERGREKERGRSRGGEAKAAGGEMRRKGLMNYR